MLGLDGQVLVSTLEGVPAQQAQHKHLAAADPRAVALQGREDLCRLACGNCAAKLRVHREPVQAVLQAAATQVQQALEHSAAGLQLHLGLVFHGAGGSALDGEVHRAHHDQQQ